MRRCDMYKTGIQRQCQENISAKQQNAGRGHSLVGIDSAPARKDPDVAATLDAAAAGVAVPRTVSMPHSHLDACCWVPSCTLDQDDVLFRGVAPYLYM